MSLPISCSASDTMSNKKYDKVLRGQATMKEVARPKKNLHQKNKTSSDASSISVFQKKK